MMTRSTTQSKTMTSLAAFLVMVLLAAPLGCTAFSLSGNNGNSNNHFTSKHEVSPTSLSMGLFGGDSDNNGDNSILKRAFSSLQKDSNPDGSKTVLNIPVQNVKPRPLRFFLQIYVVGQQNEKDAPQRWLPRESEEGDGLQIYYKDGTGMCQINFNDGNDNIVVERHGQRPSLEYLLQESVMLHGVLDELYNIAFEVEDVKESQKLLLLDESAISKARENLPARQA